MFPLAAAAGNPEALALFGRSISPNRLSDMALGIQIQAAAEVAV
ncbi:hypothetical protein [Methylomicrobium agile]|nr:hypothetical protein [Methylomicrobium agile]